MPDDGGTRPGGAQSTNVATDTHALYQETILDHYRRPRNRGAHAHPDSRAELRNPLCGDEVTVTVMVAGDRLGEVRAESRGCSIAAASASMMTELAAGRTAADIATLRTRLDALLAGAPDAAADDSLGDLRALASLARFPARHRCALLPWEALRRALDDLVL